MKAALGQDQVKFSSELALSGSNDLEAFIVKFGSRKPTYLRSIC